MPRRRLALLVLALLAIVGLALLVRRPLIRVALERGIGLATGYEVRFGDAQVGRLLA